MNFTSFLVALPFIGQLITLIALGYFITYIPFKVFERLVFKKASRPLTAELGQRMNYWFDPNISLTDQEKELRDIQMMFSKLVTNPLSYDFSDVSDLRASVQNRPPFESLSSEQLLEELLATPSIYFHFDIVVAQTVIAFLQIEGQRRYPADFQSFRNFVRCACSEILVFPEQYKECPRLLRIMRQRDEGMILDEQKRLLNEIPEAAPMKRARQKI
ncbi:hypothetical protein [Variovorax sp. W2I14]|uniref:hypothetical protein n=1 Tax=Variovorax sp. W2I14 TaxID=3042290 RepID=UPI003D1D4AF9